MRILLLAAAVSVGAACGSRTEPAVRTREPAAAAPLPTTADVEAARALRAEQTKEAKEWLSVYAAHAVERDEAWKRAHPGDPLGKPRVLRARPS